MATSIDREIDRILREEMRLEESLSPPRTAALRKSERGMRKVLRNWVRQSGLDTKTLEALQADHLRERGRGVQKLKRVASRQGAARRKIAVQQARALRATASPAVVGPLPGGVLLVVLDEPRRIRTFPNPDVLTDSRISPGDNFAKIRVDRKNRGRDRLSFVFTWENTSALPVIVDAAATLTANGLLDLHVNDGWLGNIGVMEVSTRMSVMRSPGVFGAAVSEQVLRSILAFNYPWWTAQDAGGPVSQAVDHSVRGFVLAGSARLMVILSLTVFSDFDDGRGIADFDFGLFGVGVPQVVLTVTPKPVTFISKG